MRRSYLQGLIVTISAVSLQLSGCTGRSLPSVVPTFRSSPPALVDVDSLGYQLLAVEDVSATATPSGDVSDFHRAFHKKLFAALNLSAEQKDLIKEIKTKHKAEMKKLGGKAERDKLKELLLAPTVDRAAVLAQVTTMEGICRAKIPHIVAMATEVREVLLPEQRAKAIAVFKEAQTKNWSEIHEQMTAKLMANMNLNPSQTQALTDLKNKTKSLKEQQIQGLLSAMSQFMEDGNGQALTDTLNGMIGTGPKEEGIAWVASLDASQRETLIKRMEKLMKKMKADHEMDS